MRPNNISIASNIIKPPCTKECKDREVGCHSLCARYISYVNEKNKIKREMAEQSKKDADFMRYKGEMYRKITRSH